MKPTLFILPVLALVVVAGWIGSERNSISTLEQQSAVLKERLAARSSGSGPDTSSSKAKSPDKLAKEKERIDWKKVAVQMAEMRQSNGMGDMRTMIRMQQKLQSMSKEELVSALDEIAALDLPDETRQMLEQMLIGPLCQKDPEFALTRYIDRLNGDRGVMGWQLSNAMKEWAIKDPAKATAWFDQQIAAGKFDSKSLDGKSRSRMQFEGMLIGTLISTDPAGAAARLTALPADQRAEVLRNNTGNAVKEEDQLAFAKLVRAQLPEGEQARTLAQQASQNAYGEGYTKVTEYLDRIEATPAERAVCVSEAADSKIQQLSQNKKITRDDIDALREWATTQAPGTTDKVTGTALGRSTEVNKKLEFSEAAELATQYHEASGNDDVLVGFLSNGPGYHHKEEARILAGKITDPKRRDEILNELK
ncbi:MAG: hypothetical protein ABIS50_08030 [Luteolibacter sp.]|uniref:hypothetical protein n=1 Tax=Luteolibacter sp. TaxID=1962973 RepID=UPI003264DAE4